MATLYNNQTEEDKKKNKLENYLTNYNERYQAEKAELESQKAQAKRQQDVLQQRMSLYLPQQMQQYGLGGSGYSESTLAKAYGNYANNMAGIDRTYAGMQNNVLSKYLDKQDEDNAQLYNDFMDRVNSGNFNTYGELSNYYNAIKNNLNSTQQQIANQALSTVEKSPLRGQDERNYYSQFFTKENGEQMSYKEAKQLADKNGGDYSEAFNNVYGDEKNKQDAIETIRSEYPQYANGLLGEDGRNSTKSKGVVDIYSPDFSNKDFGEFAGKNNPLSNQNQLVEAYVKEARSGSLTVGSLCDFNYGAGSKDSGLYVYAGNGIFVKYYKKGNTNTIQYPKLFFQGKNNRLD